MMPLTDATISSRAAVFRGGSDVAYEDLCVPYPARGQVRVRLEGCGVCASNLPVWEGRPWFQYPLAAGAPGHEGWGVIDAVGSDVPVRVGDRVALLSGNAYASHEVVPAEDVVRLPRALDGQPFPGEPLACVMNIFERSEIRSGQTVAIVGIGFLGAALTALAVRAGARVIAVSRRDFALEVAERFGAHARVRLKDPESTLGEVRQICGDSGCERIIEAVGTQEALDVASGCAGVRSRLIIAGYHQDGSRRVDLQHWNWLGLDVINAHERDPARYRKGMHEAIELITSGAFDPTPLYTHRFDLKDIGAAFRTLAQRPDGFIKALVTTA
jgi:NADPH:quinone reductase